MQTIPFDSIIIPQFRQRRSFDQKKIDELAQSISSSKGLLQPLVVREDGVTLVAGQRRLIAITQLFNLGLNHISHNGVQLPPYNVPVVKLSSLSPTELFEAELEENLLREDLSWQDKALAIANLHELRNAQKGGTQTLKATAEEIAGHELKGYGQPIVDIRENLLVAKHLDDPDVAKAKTLKEAKKIVSTKLENIFKAALAENFSDTSTDHRIYNADFTSILVSDQYKDFFDCIIADPPYGIDADSFGTQATTPHKYIDSAEEAWLTVEALASCAMRSLKQNGHAYIFCAIEFFPRLQEIFQKQGFNVWPRPLIWAKGDTGMLPEPDYGPRYTYEAILFARKGQRRTTAVYADVLRYSPVETKLHAAQKPVELYVDLLQRSCYPGDRVLDPVCGSGTIFPAANKLMLKAVGIELDPEQVTNAKLRLNCKE